VRISTLPPIRTRSTVSGEPTRGLIDTNIVVHLAALDPVLLPDEMVVSAITLAELSAGPHHTDDPVERARRTSVLQHTEATFDPLPFDAEAARTYGMICAAVLAAGRTPRRRVADLMIASVAAANRLPLYTTNPGDFIGLDQLVKVVAIPRPSAR
jgi:predicted nucleic acid-binding protein